VFVFRLLVLLVVCLPVVAEELEFSHQVHLGKVGLSCNVCHSAVMASENASDHNLPKSELCLACHNGQTAPAIDATSLTARQPVERGFSFSHKQHLAYENVAGRIAEAIDNGRYLGPVPDIRAQLDSGQGCVGCHRGLEEASEVDSTLHLPLMADCLVCHDKIDNPFSCETCHAPGFELKPDSHTRDFVDEHSTGKMSPAQKITCQPCHGRTFTCMGCH
jgi:c(7)-type cytochrome triheme protein